MNCQTFSALASDLARDQIMDAASRAQALAHAGVCPSCAVWLNAQQQLSSDLRRVGFGDERSKLRPLRSGRSLSAAFDAARSYTHHGKPPQKDLCRRRNRCDIDSGIGSDSARYPSSTGQRGRFDRGNLYSRAAGPDYQRGPGGNDR